VFAVADAAAPTAVTATGETLSRPNVTAVLLLPKSSESFNDVIVKECSLGNCVVFLSIPLVG
jgi:hypothetical protein